jgi:hypothetical protein
MPSALCGADESGGIMNLEQIVVLALALLFLGGIAIVIIKSKQKQKVENVGNLSGSKTDVSIGVDERKRETADRH